MEMVIGIACAAATLAAMFLGLYLRERKTSSDLLHRHQEMAKGNLVMSEEMGEMQKRYTEMRQENQRLRFPTGTQLPDDDEVDKKLKLSGRSVLEGVRALLIRHIWAQSGEAFDPEETQRDYYTGAAAGLEQFRVDLEERLLEIKEG